MGKYTDATSDVFSVFARPEWVSAFGAGKTFPQDHIGGGAEFIRVSVVLPGKGVNRASASGVLIAEIYVEAGKGPARINVVADMLDAFLANKTVGRTQFHESAMGEPRPDPANASMTRARYEIPLNYYGVT